MGTLHQFATLREDSRSLRAAVERPGNVPVTHTLRPLSTRDLIRATLSGVTP